MENINNLIVNYKLGLIAQCGIFRLNKKWCRLGLCSLFGLALGVIPVFAQNGGGNQLDVDSLIAANGTVYTGHYNKPIFGHSSFTINGKKHPLDARQYQAYKHDGTWFKSVQLSASADPVWMRWLEKGTINLYEFVSYGAARRASPRNLPESRVVWLAQKNKGPLLNVNGVLASQTKAKDNMHRLLLDQPDLAGELNVTPFNTRLIRGLIAAYNRRAGKQYNKNSPN